MRLPTLAACVTAAFIGGSTFVKTAAGGHRHYSASRFRRSSSVSRPAEGDEGKVADDSSKSELKVATFALG